MQIVINPGNNEIIFDELMNVDFAPQSNLLGGTLPINQFSVDIQTDYPFGGIINPLDPGTWAIEPVINKKVILRDDDRNVFAYYTIIDIQERTPNVKRIIAQSSVALLAKRNWPAIMYEEYPVVDIIHGLFGNITHYIDTSFDSMEITGYWPGGTRRECLQWILFMIGGYVKDYFESHPYILPLDDTNIAIPHDQTYWMPELKYADYVTRVTVRSYAYTEATPQSGDDYVKVGGTTYTYTTLDTSYDNPDVPSYVEPNEIIVRNNTLIDSTYVSDILNRMGNYYFHRRSVEAKVVDVGDYYPGMCVSVPFSSKRAERGYIEEADFEFGRMARARLKVIMAEDIQTAKLTIKAKWNSKTVAKQTYYFAVGAQYTVQNPYFDRILNSHRYIFRPVNETVSGTMPSVDTVVEEPYQPALDYYKSNLYIISVDELNESEGVVSIE